MEKMDDKNYCYKYPRPAVTTDCVVFGFDGSGLNVLLIERGREPFKGQWAFPGGFLEMNETAEEGAARELHEETGVKDIFMEQLQVFSAVNRDPRERVVTIAFYALVRQHDYRVAGGDDAAKAKWFPLSDIPPLAFDHQRILMVAEQRLRMKIQYDPHVVFRLLDKTFTLQQLQCICESIPGIGLNGQKFCDKLQSSGYIKKADEREGENTFRQSPLYLFDEQRYNEVNQHPESWN